jgi:hypothetical protein
MAIMRDQLPNTQVVILRLSSPDLADGLMRGKIASPPSAMNANITEFCEFLVASELVRHIRRLVAPIMRVVF